ncbi:MAG: aminotransferase class V-fold PLP-dependent enzyme [Verrucomicrobiota bacterium]
MSAPLFADESARIREFPVCGEGIFLAHAAVTALPRVAAEAMANYAMQSAGKPQEFGEVLRDMRACREACANLIGAKWQEVALLGPTSLGLSLFANGIDWAPGDEVVCYADDYPANVYPWLELRRRGVVVHLLRPDAPGEITPERILSALSPRTRLVALASCHFFNGYRLDVESIGALLRERGIIFALDAIQTLGAFPLDVVKANVDLLSADAHKWLLGPMAMGIVYVAERLFDTVRPTLLGAWNVNSPRFLAQDCIEFVPTAQRYEPGVLNTSGMYGMKAAIDLLQEVGISNVASRILELKAALLERLDALGFVSTGPRNGPTSSGITTVSHPMVKASELFRSLEKAGVTASLRYDRAGNEYLRFSPHYYNSIGEFDRLSEILAEALSPAS